MSNYTPVEFDVLYMSNTSESAEPAGARGCHLDVATVDWNHVESPFIIATFLFCSALIKLGFHHAGFLVSKIPESCVLIVLGTLAGTIFTFATDKETFPKDLSTLDPVLFFMVLLPPIILEAAYSLHDRAFFENLGSILIYAVCGTLLTFFLIGSTLWGLSEGGVLGGEKISFMHCMLFASVIVAVDPVAVLAIFQECGVNSVLYFLVFGESLMNDAMTLVLYKTMEGFNCYQSDGMELTVGMFGIAVGKFFASSIGGSVIGVLFGVLTSVLTKHTVEVRVVEPLILFSLAYLSYVTAELFHFSAILGICCCGLVQAQYAFHNISHKSYVTVKYFTKMASSAADSVIFLYLGMNLVRLDHVWHSGFLIANILLTLIYRFIVTYLLSYILNLTRVRHISHREQFIMAYGGLRGAVAFSLISMITAKQIQSMFMTTTLVIIIFTVFIQGGTIKPLVSLLEIRRQNKEEILTLFDELHCNVTDHLMAGIEELVGNRGQFFFYDAVISWDDKYIKNILMRTPFTKDEKIMKLYEKIALKQHFANLPGSEAATHFMQKSLSLLVDQQTPAVPLRGSIVSVHRPSLVFVNRFGTVVDPGEGEDIAFFAPELLDDEDEGASRRKLRRQQTTVAESIARDQVLTATSLRVLLSKPPSTMEVRSIHKGGAEMDDRSDLMYMLQEKSKRMERFKRTQSNMGEHSMFNVVPSAMATIPEDHGRPTTKRAVKQNSLDFRLAGTNKPRRSQYNSRPSNHSPLTTDQGSTAVNPEQVPLRIHKDVSKQKMLLQLHDVPVVNFEDRDTQDGPASGSIKRAQVKSDPGQKNNNNDLSQDVNPHKLACRKDTIETILDALANHGELDVEKGQRSGGARGMMTPLAHSSQGSDSDSATPSHSHLMSVVTEDSDESEEFEPLLSPTDKPDHDKETKL